MSDPAAADRAQRFLTFLSEARRRKVYVAVVAYIAVAIAMIEIGDAVTAALELPPSTTRVLTILLMLGFPVVVVLAWVFDITTQGVVRTEPRRKSRPVNATLASSAAPSVPSAGVRSNVRADDDGATAAAPDPERIERATLGHMRHELRTPVNAIVGYSEMLLEDAGDPAIEKDLRRILQAGRELLAHIDRLLAAGAGPRGEEDRAAFAARVGAELRTPATTVRGYAELLIETCRDSGRLELVPDLERIVIAAARALETSSNLAVTGAPPEGDSADAAEMTRGVLAGMRPVMPGSVSVDGEGRILVVDDNAMNRDLMLRQLARSGYIVDAAEDGIVALERIAQHDYDVVLLDMLMPRMNGAETLRRIRADERLAEVPVVMLSSLDETDTAVRCLELGADEYLTKPFQPTLLAARIASNIMLRRLRARDRALTAQVEQARSALQRVAGSGLPPDAAARLIRGEGGAVHASAGATVVACMIPRSSRRHDVQLLIEDVDRLVRALGELADEHDLSAPLPRAFGAVLTVGLSPEDPDHARLATELARQAVRAIDNCAAGLHTGPVTGGVIGGARPHYDVWGETVDCAEALALTGAPGSVTLTPSTHALVREHFELAAGPVAELAGHGHMRSWLLRGEPELSA